MTSRSHYFAQQAAANVASLEAPARRPGQPAPHKRRPAAETIGSFTGTWKALRHSQYNAHLVDVDGRDRCTGEQPRRGFMWVKPARSASKCARCVNPAYCPDCGDTTTVGHRAECIYGGQR